LAFDGYILTGMHGPTCIFWANLTPFSLKLIVEHHRGERGSPLWMAPELTQGEGFTPECDVYSYGIVLWQVGPHTPHRVNTMMKLFHSRFSIQNMESP
jgi:serine/threonine protein kinase